VGKTNLVGKRFGAAGLLTVIAEAPSDKGPRWQCLCICGETFVTKASYLKSKRVTDCGCFAKEEAADNKLVRGYKVEPKVYKTSEKQRAWNKKVSDRAKVTGSKEWAQRVISSGKPVAARGGYLPLNITVNGLVAACAKWDGGCECCGKMPKRPTVDHCHSTGKLRGFLCANCNKGIGLLGDTTAGVRNAVAYLEK